MPKLDKDYILRETKNDLKLLEFLRPGGHDYGTQYTAPYKYDPSRESFSYLFDSGIWCDEIIGTRGNIIDLVADSLGIPRKYSYYYAMIWLNRYLDYGRDIDKAAIDAPFSAFHNMLYGPKGSTDEIFEIYQYNDERGGVAGYGLHVAPVAGVDLKNGVVFKKHFDFTEAYFVAVARNQSTGRSFIHNLPWGRPLYNLPEVIRTDNIIIVNDPQAAATAASRIWRRDDMCITTWSGGRHQVQRANWLPVNNKNVLIFIIERAFGPKETDWRDAEALAGILSRPGMKNKVSVVDALDFKSNFGNAHTLYEAVAANGFGTREINEYIKGDYKGAPRLKVLCNYR